MHWLLFALILGLDTLAMYTGHQAAQSKNIYLWALTILIFAVMGGLFVRMLQFETLTIINLFWVVGAIVLGTTLGVLIFKEQVTNLQWFGVALAILSVIIIQWPTK